MRRLTFKKNPLAKSVALAVLGTSGTGTAIAQTSEEEESLAALEVIEVTATRRLGSIQDVPINIAALDGDTLEKKGIGDVSQLLRFVPGIVAIDQGGRNGNPIIVRGVNADPLGQGDGNDQGETVATYLGEIPLDVDLRITDLDRVEVLLGPQGTLYGAGTLSGAIRYIPTKPQFDATTVDVRGDVFSTDESGSFGNDVGITFNAPLSENFAFRVALDRYDDPGFIDQPFIVREIGVSEPDAALGSDQFDPQEDVNGQESLTGKLMLRWENEYVDATLSYIFQEEDNEGRTISSHRGQRTTGIYENAQRVLEPNEEDTELLALEVIADLGFAELTSATGFTKYEEVGQRDQTDLLISLEYSYETFPTFTAFTREEEEEETFNQEIRLVSTSDSDLNWIVGAFYNKNEFVSSSSEFTPGYAQFAGFDRPDNLEYFAQSREDITEQAIFGEIGYQITDKWQVTIGGRYYDYDIESFSDVDFPLFDPDFVALTLDEIAQSEFDPDLAQSDSGTLFKFNTSYKVNDDVNVYATISEGFRIGGSNGGGPCPEFDPDASQGNCNLAPGQQFGPDPVNDVAQFDERAFGPDTTRNHEFGVKSQLLDGSLKLNGAIYYIEWEDNQLSSATVNASIPITINGNGAESRGIEASFDWLATDSLRISGSFSRVESELSADVPSLIRTISPPGFATAFEDGETGDRLPGSPEQQVSLSAVYFQDLSNGAELIYNADFAWQSDILSRTGGRGGSFTLPSFGVAYFNVSYVTDEWTVTAYVDNVFDKFAETGVQSTPLINQTVNGATVRSFVTNVLRPRTIGVRFTYNFGEF